MSDNIFKFNNLNIYYYVIKMQNHNTHKKILLNYFNNKILSNRQFGLNKNNQNINIDSIYNYDYKDSTNFDREWVIYIKKYIQEILFNLTNYIPYKNAIIMNMWFQQYKKNDKHSWHLHHGCTYSGVYYVECQKENITEYLDFLDIGNPIKFNAEEGDVVIFPSLLLHRSPPIESDVLKTIISFNFDYTDNCILE